jgi:hypothetical protein
MKGRTVQEEAWVITGTWGTKRDESHVFSVCRTHQLEVEWERAKLHFSDEVVITVQRMPVVYVLVRIRTDDDMRETVEGVFRTSDSAEKQMWAAATFEANKSAEWKDGITFAFRIDKKVISD